jgi:replicative DNA helicase
MAPVNPTDPQTVAYSKTMDALKNIALGFGVPMVVGVQASREVEQLEVPIPEMHHAQWTSNIEQSSDRVLSLVRPRRYRAEGETFGSRMVSGQSQLLIDVLKQKLGEANFIEWASVNPIYNTLNNNEQEVEEKYG